MTSYKLDNLIFFVSAVVLQHCLSGLGTKRVIETSLPFFKIKALFCDQSFLENGEHQCANRNATKLGEFAPRIGRR